MTREELELSTDIRDFTTLIYVILRHESSECRLELSIKSDLGMRFAIWSLVQSPNSLFFPPPIGAEPGRAKRESRIICMRMLRTNQSKITRVLTTLLASMCRAMPFSAHALKKKHIFFDVDIVVKNIKT